ncbi:hypothetical protein BDY24DRAFT_127649 [Mrakia frigida]|uniref:Ran GTPase-binding protein MOG1 n=1 Tax=Mrakia frigida TaxID=29902 RepID=UPI003FCC2129
MTTHNPSPSYSTRPLFGGALTISLPTNLIDASDLRQVPDTQEVFLSPDSDISYIIEILQQVEGDECEAVAKFHFSSLEHDNSSVSSQILAFNAPPSSSSSPTTFSSLPPSPPNQPPLATLKGTQVVPKFGKGAGEEVCIFLGVWRVGGKKTDILLTVNCPEEQLRAFGEKVFEEATRSFKVVEWGLFAD